MPGSERHEPPRRPLEGIRVLDFTHVLGGPFATMLLGDLGAEVIKVEPPWGDVGRSIPPHFVDGDSGFFLSVGRNKKSVVLDLKSDEGQSHLRELIRTADVAVNNFTPKTAADLGLTYDALKAVNPQIVNCALFGFHDEGGAADEPAFDLLIQALSGLMSITGAENGEPARVGYQIADLAGGLYAALGTVAALMSRALTGQGREVSVSLYDCQLSLMSWQAQNLLISGEQPRATGTRHPLIVPSRAFQGSEGAYFVINITGESFWKTFCTAIDRDDLCDDPRFKTMPDRLRNRVDLEQILEDMFAQEGRDHWLRVLKDHGLPAAPVRSLQEALDDPLAQIRGMLVDATSADGRTLPMIGDPIKTGSVPRYEHPPRLGEHTAEVLDELDA